MIHGCTNVRTGTAAPAPHAALHLRQTCFMAEGRHRNAIGGLRRVLPREIDPAWLTWPRLDRVGDRGWGSHNDTPRRCLGYRTSAELF
jgi:hypothetical protein